MRLHHLRVSAFGPFASTSEVDFEDLSAAGLFLLSGPTGAGKSSILDAVCFALYGDVPGDRAGAKRLRCDQAAPGVAPRVVLDLTLSGRRFRLDRSPSWTRPKKRGEGFTTEQARVVLSERVDGEWVPLSTRLDEVGHQVTRLVGMNLPQFCQVAMLPQGRFQAFLRARSEDRHALLQQVFRTGRFDQVERWLREHRLQLRRRSDAQGACVSDLVSRFSESSGRPAPHEDADVVAWSKEVQDQLGLEVEASRAAREAAQEHDAEARRLLDIATTSADLRRAHAVAAAEQAGLRARSAEHEDDVRRVAAARRTVPVQPWHALAVSCDAADLAARARRVGSMAEVVRLVGPEAEDSAPGLRARARDAVEVLARVRALRPAAASLNALTGREEAATARIETLRDRCHLLEQRVEAVPVETEEIRVLLQHARTAATRVPAAQAEVESLLRRLDAGRRSAETAEALHRAEEVRAEAVTTLHAAKEHWLDLRERRLEGMAAEIATRLVVGDSCPVCGSHDHPSLARTSPGAPDATAEQAARKSVDDHEALVVVHDEQVRDLAASLAALDAEAGSNGDDLAALVGRARSDLALLEDEAATLVDLESRLATLGTEGREVAAALTDARSELERLRATAADTRRSIEEVRAQLDALVRLTGHADLDDVDTHFRDVERACEVALDDLADAERASEAASAGWERARAEALEAGFADLESFLSAVLPDAERQQSEERIEEHRHDLLRVEAVLEDPEVRAAMVGETPDLAAATSRAAQASTRLTAASSRHEGLVARRARAESLRAELVEADAVWAPVRDQLALVTSLSSFVEGKSADNRLQMRLSAYVLAHRLSQVVAAANMRLSSMSDQRYALEHTGRRGSGETRGGLSLLVRDDWSGESRDPATLSGGETFVVSLALALGLADVITQEAGGADLDTLFVDEGFGSLDADTLDDVMDTLDSLRDGGRVVAVVSHVAEMQSRIPTQLRVHKGRSGSRISQVVG